MFSRGGGVVQAFLKITEHGVEQVIRFEGLQVLDGIDRFHAGSRAIHLGQGHGPIEGDYRRIIDFHQAII